MSYTDQTLTCRDCSKEFTWTSGEQEFFAQKGFGTPVRCPDCRKNRRNEKNGPKKLYDITCKQCGKQGQVPFEPRDPSNLLCAECFKQSKQAE